MSATPHHPSRSSRLRVRLGLASIAIAPVLAGCGDPSRPIGPGALLAVGGGATKTHVEFPISVDQVGSLPCPTGPIHFVYSGIFAFDWTNTPSDLSSGRASIVFDRTATYIEYNGVTYRLAQGHPSHDLIQHFLNGPNGMYVETGVFLDFESSDTGDRLILQATFVMVIDPNGNIRLGGVTHGAGFDGHCGAPTA